MSDIFSDVAHLRELAAKCRRVAAGLSDPEDVTSLRQMAVEYEAMAARMSRKLPKEP